MAIKNTVKIQKIGNSYMITLTKDIIDKSGFKLGEQVGLQVENDQIIVRKNKFGYDDRFKLIGNLQAPKKVKYKDLVKAMKEGPYERLHLL